MAEMHREFAVRQEAAPTSAERRTREYIDNINAEYYDSSLCEDNTPEVFCHLSVLRSGLYSWYDFKEDAAVLEVNAGFGALTGLLCQKCAHVTVTETAGFRAEAIASRWKAKDNLTVYMGEWTEIPFPGKFDYVILTGTLEYLGDGCRDRLLYAEYLRKALSLLTEDGVLLLAVENRLGLKYICGAPELHTNRAFDGLNGYPKGTDGYSFSRQELVDIMRDAGVSNHKFYYPLPDYRLPQLIYTDSHLPDKNIRERLIPYYYDKRSMVAEEKSIYDDIIENRVFPFFSNSFLVECYKGREHCNVVYAAVSTDRGAERSFATAIYADGLVYKRPVFEEGRRNALALFTNADELKNRGIPVVAQKWTGNGIEMPYIEYPTLSDCLKSLLFLDKQRFYEILDELYAFILASSEHEDASRNLLAVRLLQEAEENDREKIRALDWGPVLKRLYMELMPLNCFYNHIDREYLFFDQEFVRESYPAKYVMFRTIFYLYCFTPGAEAEIPQSELRKKYGLDVTWDYYLKEEHRFLDEVRNKQTYRQFYQWANVSKKQIELNIDRLGAAEKQKITGPSGQTSDLSNGRMHKIWDVELQIADVVSGICERHEIKYFMINGTLLGAVRHNGFIPWDDDLDIGMCREDYERFLKAAEEELPAPYYLQTMWKEEDCFFGGYARIRNSVTTGIQAVDVGHKGNQGIWIDILPFDTCTVDEKKRRRKEKRLRYWHTMMECSIYGSGWGGKPGMQRLRSLIHVLLSGIYTHKFLCGRIERAMRMYTDEPTEEIAAFTGCGPVRAYSASDFEKTVSLLFEGRRLPAPAGYEEYLCLTYGRDYMTYPPEEERKPKHRGIFDADRPYTDYVRKLDDMFEDAGNRKIILFGAGMMFDDYMQKWGRRYRPAFIVDNDRNKWGRKRQGIEIKSPHAILEVAPQKRRLIICSFYYKEIERQLLEMGITDYKVYIQQLDWVLKAEKQK